MGWANRSAWQSEIDLNLSRPPPRSHPLTALLPTDPTDRRSLTPADSARWVSFNSFVARLLDSSIVPWIELPIWSLRESLESDLSTLPTPLHRDTQILTACHWAVWARDLILRQSQASKELSESETRSLRPGELYDGPSGYSLPRLRFWESRLRELKDQEGLSEQVKAAVEKATNALDGQR